MEALRNALESAFNEAEMKLLVSDALGQNLESIITDPSNYPSIIQAVLEWCKRHKMLAEFVVAALRKNPNNSELKGYVTEQLQTQFEADHNSKPEVSQVHQQSGPPESQPTGWRRWAQELRSWRVWVAVAGIAGLATVVGWSLHPSPPSPPSIEVYPNWTDASPGLTKEEQAELRDLEKGEVLAIGLVLKPASDEPVEFRQVEIETCVQGKVINTWRAYVRRANGTREPLSESWMAGTEPIRCQNVKLARNDRLCILVGLEKNNGQVKAMFEKKATQCLFHIGGVR